MELTEAALEDVLSLGDRQPYKDLPPGAPESES
jgi:hypothetical protein